jgi:hypothetical protein
LTLRFAPLSAPAAGLLLGLVVGLTDLAILLAHPRSRGTLVLPDWTWLSVPWVWMTVCCCIGVALSGRRLHRLSGPALVLAGPGVLLLSRVATPVKDAFALSSRQILLVLGVTMVVLAVPAIRVRLEAPRRLLLWVTGSALSLALVVWTAMSVNPADRFSGERPAAKATGSRNVVLVFLDTARYDDAIGSMPRLARFRSGAVSFDNAWAPAPWTIPSHFAVLTGLDPHRVPVDPETDLYRGSPTMLAQRFDGRGYATAAVFANALLTPDAGFARGYDEYTAVGGAAVCRSAIGDVLRRMWIHDGPRSQVCGWFTAPDVTDRALSFLRRAQRPFFLTLNYLDGHDPYYVRPECGPSRPLRRAQRETLHRSRPDAPVSRTLALRAHQQYREALQCLDGSLGKLLDVLENDPDWATTSVIFVSDHGEHFGEHGLGSHGNSLYPAVLHVPLIARIPGVAPGRVTNAVAIADLYAALVANLEDPAAPFRMLDPALRRPVIGSYEMGPPFGEGGFSFTGDRFHYIRWNDGREALFERARGEVPLATQPDWVNVARDAVSRAREARRESNAFDALGYLR